MRKPYYNTGLETLEIAFQLSQIESFRSKKCLARSTEIRSRHGPKCLVQSINTQNPPYLRTLLSMLHICIGPTGEMIAAGLQSTHSPRPSGAALPQSQSQTDHQDLGSRKSSARSKMSSSSDVIIACTRSETDMRRLKLCAFIMLEAPKTKKYNHNFANSHFLF